TTSEKNRLPWERVALADDLLERMAAKQSKKDAELATGPTPHSLTGLCKGNWRQSRSAISDCRRGSKSWSALTVDRRRLPSITGPVMTFPKRKPRPLLTGRRKSAAQTMTVEQSPTV